MKWFAAMLVIAVAVGLVEQRPTMASPNATSPRYLSPGELAMSADGTRLYVVCEKSDELLVLDTATGSVMKRVPVGHQPRGISLSEDGKRIYVANSWIDTVSVIDADKLEVVGSIATGFEPTSTVSDREGKTLYVANRLSNDISVIALCREPIEQ